MALFVDKMLPLSLLEHASFKAFVSELDPRFKIPCRLTMLRKITDSYNNAVALLHHDLSGCASVSLTHDSWTSLMTESYDTITVHYINSDWDLHSGVLQTSHFAGKHTGENISHHLAAVIKSWNLRDYVFVTDNAANEQKAIRLLGAPRIGCYGHRLNLVVKHALANTDACHLVEKGRHLVTFFHCSTSATELLLEKQKLLLPEAEQNHRLIQDVQTRWNSTLDMLSRLYEQHQTLCAVAADTGVLGKRAKKLGSKLYTFKEQNDVKDLIDLLQPFKIATQTLSSDKYPTQGLILPVLKKLSLALEIRPDDSVMIKAMKADMTMQLESRTTDKDYAFVASLLTPSTKQMLFISDEDRLIAHNLLFEQLLESHTKFLVKNEQTIDQNANTLVDLPELPSLPGPSADVTSEQICVSDELKPEVCSVPSKKIKTTIEDKKETHGTSWLQDVIFVSQSEPLSPKELASNELKLFG